MVKNAGHISSGAGATEPATGGIEPGTGATEIEALLAEYPRTQQSLVPMLQRLQEHFGYLPPQVLEQVARHLRMSPSQVFGVVTFYAQFRLTPRGRHTLKVCRGTACHVRRGASIRDAIERHLGVESGQTTPDLKYTYEAIACFGACALAPVVIIDDVVYGHMTQDKLHRLLARLD